MHSTSIRIVSVLILIGQVRIKAGCARYFKIWGEYFWTKGFQTVEYRRDLRDGIGIPDQGAHRSTK